MTGSSFNVRTERPGDASAICEINAAAFGGPVEGRIVDLLRERKALSISLVAESEGLIVGHIAFSAVRCDGNATGGLGLGPVAVVPARQRQGVGSALIRAGLDRCRAADVSFVVLLGDPAYYARFGFVPASRFNLRCIYHDGDAFQVLETEDGALKKINGLIRYDAAFDDAASV